MSDDKRRAGSGVSRSIAYVPSFLSEAMLADLESAIQLDLQSLQLAGTIAKVGVADRKQVEASADLDRRIYSLSYLQKTIFSKYVILSKDGATQRRDDAIDKWLLMEQRNAKANHRILALPAVICGMETEKILEKAAQFVSNVIGQTPPPDILFGNFSGGASTSQKRGPGAIAAKFEAKADVTDDAWLAFQATLETSEAWLLNGWKGSASPRRVPGNVLFTVPKNSKIDRVAAKEPDLNMFAQKGIGNFFRSRLLKFGVDLNDQTVNQRLAEEGSRSHIYATVDLSSASDTICTSIVCRLLAPDWFVLLDRCRSKHTVVRDNLHELNMFSSMGNGFTFELESLIFWALMRSVAFLKGVKGRINVYGDDIIVPVKLFPMLSRLFSYFGFILNREKSFGKGDFRESCGKHFYKGCDVTPFFIRSPITDQSRVIHCLNQLTSWLQRNTNDCDGYAEAGIPREAVDFPHLNRFWETYSKSVDRRFRGGGADWINTTQVLVSNDTPKCVLRNVIKEVKLHDDGAYLHWLRVRHDRVDDQARELNDLYLLFNEIVKDDEKQSSGEVQELLHIIGVKLAKFQELMGQSDIRLPVVRLYEASLWTVIGDRKISLELSEPLCTSIDAYTLDSAWVVRPYRDVLFAEDPRK
jgi:hypothetical protein